MNNDPIHPIKFNIICPIEFIDPEETNFRIEFSIPGKPFGKQRPRVINRRGFVHTYTPKETANYEKLVKKSYLKHSGGRKLYGPISAKIEGIFPIPKSISKKQKEKMISKYHTKKPDSDNIGKSILDGLNGTAYDDDSQICDLNIRKIYGKEPKTIVILEELKR